MPQQQNAGPNTPTTPNPRGVVPRTPRIAQYTSSYTASPESSARTMRTPVYAGRHSLLSHPETPPASPATVSTSSSSSSRTPISTPSSSSTTQPDVINLVEDDKPTDQSKLGVGAYILHTASCTARTVMMLAWAVAIWDVKCLAAGRNLFTSISNNYKVDKILFALTCAAIMFSIAVSLSASRGPAAIVSNERIDAQIREAIEQRMNTINTLIKMEIGKEKGISQDMLEAQFRKFSAHINDVINSKYELQNDKITQKAAEVASEYLRNLQERTTRMETISNDVTTKYDEIAQSMSVIQVVQQQLTEIQSLIKSPPVTKDELENKLKEQRHQFVVSEGERLLEMRDFVKNNFVTNEKLTDALAAHQHKADASILNIVDSKITGLNSRIVSEDTIRSWVVEELTHGNPATKSAIHNIVQQEVQKALPEKSANSDAITLSTVERTVVDIVSRYTSTLNSVENQKATIERWIKEAISQYSPSSGAWDEVRITQVVEDALERFAADRVGKSDYALFSTGASIVDNTPSFKESSWSLVPLPFIRKYTRSHPASVILEPDVTVGRCWAFEGSNGFATIELSEPVVVTSVTLDHIPKSLARVKGLASAPKDFSVYGLHNKEDTEGVLLGQFTYDVNSNKATQTFDITSNVEEAFRFVSLRINSNYGHHYTCVYRFRVHSDKAAAA